MDVNITLFLQVAQFAIAYFFLYKFLFAPAYKILHEQELYEQKLHRNLEDGQQTKNSLQTIYHERQVVLKESLIEMIPTGAVQQCDAEKLDTGTMLYQVEKVEISHARIQAARQFLVDNLSRVIK